MKKKAGQNRQLHIIDFIPINSFGAVSQPLVLLQGAVAGTNNMRIDSGFHFLPQGPEAVLGQLEGCDSARFNRRHSNAKGEALQVGH